jgi:hypothetical protein
MQHNPERRVDSFGRFALTHLLSDAIEARGSILELDATQ